MADFLGTFDDDTLVGSQQDDVIYGRGGDDDLDGRGRNDDIFGQSGEDTLVGNFGEDTLTGGADADVFFFNFPDEGIDIIEDFELEEDVILVSADGFFIDEDEFDAFGYDSDTGEVFFEDTVFAVLTPALDDFDVEIDLTIV